MLTITTAGQQLLLDTTKHWCLCWRVTLKNSTTYKWTNHDEDVYLPFQGSQAAERFRPIAGLQAGNVRRQAGLKDHSTPAEGIIVDNGDVTIADLQAGRWRDATFEELVVDHVYTWLAPLFSSTYKLRNLRFTGEVWQGELKGISYDLERDQGIFLNRTCRHPFGGAFGAATNVVGCRYDLASDTQSVVVSTVTDRRTFTSANLTEADGYWDLGEVTFVSGSNTGIDPIRVKTFTASTDTVVLALPTPFDIEVGDAFRIARGCAKTKEACEGFSQYPDNFGGSNIMPTKDEIRSTPRQN